MELDLLVLLPGAQKKERPLLIRKSSTSEELLDAIFKQYSSQILTGEGESASDWGLFLPALDLWLPPKKQLSELSLSNQVRGMARTIRPGH